MDNGGNSQAYIIKTHFNTTLNQIFETSSHYMFYLYTQAISSSPISSPFPYKRLLQRKLTPQKSIRPPSVLPAPYFHTFLNHSPQTPAHLSVCPVRCGLKVTVFLKEHVTVSLTHSHSHTSSASTLLFYTPRTNYVPSLKKISKQNLKENK